MKDEDKIIPCDPASLPKDYLITLCEVCLSTFTPQTHDLNNPGTSLLGHVTLLKLNVSKLRSLVSHDIPSEEVNSALKQIEGNAEIVEKSFMEILSFIRGYFDPIAFRYQHTETSRSARRLLYTCPMDILEEVKKEFQDTRILTGRITTKSMVIVYPKNIGFWIIRELVKNAISHNNNRATILLNWYMKDGSFHLDVHDNCHRITDAFRGPVNIETLRNSSIVPIRGTSGLSIIGTLVRLSRGAFLIWKSRRLGGNRMSIRIPVPVYFLGEKVHYV